MTAVHVLPTSFPQQRFWVLDQINPGAAAYTMPGALRLRGRLDQRALEQALNAVVSRHEALRTVFALEQDVPVQVVRPSLRVELPLEDLTALPPASREARIQEALGGFANRPFDLAQGPLLAAALLRLGPEDHVFLLVLHHIVADGWSMGVLYREIQQAYQALTAGREPAFAPLPLQYPDFAVWQRKMAERGKFAGDVSFWREALRAPLPVLDLPTDRPRPPLQTFPGASRSLVLSPGLTESIRALSRQEQATPFMTLLAAFQVLLHRYSGQPEIVVGCITSGRERAEVQALIGLFLNTVAVRTDLSADPSFRTLLGAVRETALGAYQHAAVPFEMVLEALEQEWDRSRNPVFQAGFQMLEGLGDELRLGGLAVERLASPKETAKLDLTLMVMPTAEGGLRTTLEFNTDLFDAETVDRMLAHYRTLLEGIVATPDTAVSTLPLMQADERARVLESWNRTAGAFPDATLPALISAQAARTPGAPAVSSVGTTLSYAELERRSAALAATLLARGVRRGDLVGLCLDRSADLVVGLLGILKTGAAYVPLDPEYPVDRIAYVLEDAGAAVTVSTTPLLAKLGAHAAGAIALDRDVRWTADAPALPCGNPDDLAYVIYTSGSTGRPKGVEVPHRALVNFLSSMTAAPGFTASDVLLSVTTISFDIAGLELWLPLITGGRVDVAPTDALSDGEALARLISESGATVMQATPATWRLLLEAAWPGNPQLRILCGGEALPQALADALAPRCAELWNMYGPTETTVWSAAQRIRAGERVTVGGPVRNTGLYVLDQRRQPQPIGVPGELYIGGGGVARGYHGRADLTAERFVSHPFDSAPGARMYRTGDLVRRRADGSLEFLGRLDHQVKVRGFRIELGEIEAVLATHPAVDQAVAVAQPTESGDSRLVAYYVPRQGSAPEQESLRAHLQGRLPAYMVPGALIGLTTMPLTPNGKVDRKALPRLDVAPGPDSTGPLPRNPLEAAIAAEMALVLERPAVGIHQSFFDLGGHSLLAMRLLGRLKRGPAPGLTLQAIFEHPTVAELAALAGASGAAVDTPSPIRRRPVEAPRPLSFGQRLLWVQAEMDPGLAAYNFPLARRLRGPLQPEALQTALDGLAIRHEVLRTVLTPAGDEPVQTVLPPEAVPLYRADLHHAPEPLGAAMAQARELAARPFNLAADRPLRAALYRLGEDDHVLLLVTHHAVADGWSAGVLLNDLAALYDAAVGQRASGLPALGISYGDFAAWQRDRTGEAERARLLDYWRRTLADLPATLELQTDHPRTSTVSGPGAEVVVTLAPALLERLRRVGEPGGATLFMTLLAAWQALLFRYSGQRDILVATPFAGRNTPETEGLVGYFAQTLLMRARRGVNQSFTQLLQQVRETAISAFQHADVPLDDLLRELRGAQGSGGFQAMFTYQGATAAPVGLGGLTVESLRLHTGAAKAELALFATERSDGLQLAIEYRSDLFDRETIERMQGHLAILLEGIIENPATPVDRLPMLSGAERHRLLDEWSGSATAYPRNSTISARFREIAARAPDLPAVVVDGETITYRALSERAGRLAGYLRARGIGSGALVAIALPRSADLVAALIAVLEAGAAYLPLDPDYPAERLRFMLKDAAAPLLLTCAALASVFPAESGCDVVLLEDLAAELGRLPTAPAPVEPTAESPAYVMYTSGSTGVPKGVVVPHRAVLRLVLDTDYLPPAAFTRVLGYAPITFDASTLELWGPLLNGGAVVLAPARPLSLAELGQVIVDGGVTTAWLTAALFHEMADTQIESLRGIRYLLAGGDVLSPAHVRRVLEALPGCVLINGYGPTENTTFTCCHRITPADAARGNIPIGRPIANTQVYVLDEALQPVPVGVAGELLAGGDGLAQGYLGRPDLTTERFVPDPFRPGERLYRTGDRVRWRQDRSIEFLGRLDDQVKLRGHRIELAEVEAAVGRLAGVAAVTAMVREDVPGDRRLVAYYVAANGTAPTDLELRRLLRSSLPEVMIPSAFLRLSAIPRTTNGKVDRKALPATADSTDETAGFVAPRNAIEAAVAGVWSEVLGRSRIGVEDSFFDLGGHSLLATQVVGRLSALFKVQLPLRVFFETPTVAGIADALPRHEPKAGRVAATARILQEIARMPEAERRARGAQIRKPDPIEAQ